MTSFRRPALSLSFTLGVASNLKTAVLDSGMSSRFRFLASFFMSRTRCVSSSSLSASSREQKVSEKCSWSRQYQCIERYTASFP